MPYAVPSYYKPESKVMQKSFLEIRIAPKPQGGAEDSKSPVFRAPGMLTYGFVPKL